MSGTDATTADSDARASAFRQAPVGMALVSTRGEWIDVNDALCRLLGRGREELLATTFQQLTHPDDLHADLEQVQAMLAGSITQYTMAKRYLHPDGTVVPARLSVSLAREPDGKPRHFIACIASAAADPEQESLHERSERLAKANVELERFAYVVSHDLQAPLRTIRNFGGLLARHADALPADGRSHLDRMTGAATRMSELIADLLDYARTAGSELEFEEVDLNAEAQAVLTSLAPDIEACEATVTVAELPTIVANRRMLRQVLLNLVQNALKYRRPGTNPGVEVLHRRKDGEHVLSVSDDGIGIEPRYARRIFGVFQRLHTRTEYAGTGIGLAIVDRVADRHGGRAWVVSEPGKGATFHLAIPVRDSSEVRSG